MILSPCVICVVSCERVISRERGGNWYTSFSLFTLVSSVKRVAAGDRKMSHFFLFAYSVFSLEGVVRETG